MNNSFIKFLKNENLNTKYGQFDVTQFVDINRNNKYLLISKNIDRNYPVNLHIHAGCVYGDVLGYTECRCNKNFTNALKFINTNNGMVIYLNQKDNIESGYNKNHLLFLAVEILKDINVNKINLITDNIAEASELRNMNIDIVKVIKINNFY